MRLVLAEVGGWLQPSQLPQAVRGLVTQRGGRCRQTKSGPHVISRCHPHGKQQAAPDVSSRPLGPQLVGTAGYRTGAALGPRMTSPLTSTRPEEPARLPLCPPPRRSNSHMSAAGIKAQTVAINSFGSGAEDTSHLTWPDRELCDPLAERSLRGRKSGPWDTWVPVSAPPEARRVNGSC